LLAAWAILFILPLLHFSVLFALLGSIDTRIALTINDVLGLILIGIGSFFDFGYMRLYEALLHSRPRAFFSAEDLARMSSTGDIRPGFRAHFIPGALYVIVSTLLVIVAYFLLT
jgi:hypothetical protein